MSTTIDEKVVRARFDNAQFQKGVETTLTLLDKLKTKLNLDGASKGLENVAATAKNMTLGKLGEGVDAISSKFTAMGAIAFTTLQNITNKAVDAGQQLIKSLTIAPINEGLQDYYKKLTSVQTIMNATGKSIGVVDGYFKQLDTYADKTIYNLQDMTSAFAKFTNAGVGMDKSVPAIKGIANMVALAGQGADAASIAMYNLSQSIAGGFLTTTDFKSLQLANVATKEWKDHMIAGAVAAGKLKKTGADSYHIVGTKAGEASTSAALFTENLKEGWATSDVLLKVLGDFGDETTAIGKKAQAAAQDVKSLPMMMDTLKAAVGTGWTDSFEIIFGNVEEAKKLFTGLTNTIGPWLDGMAKARNEMLQGWKDNGGRDAAIQALYNAFKAIGSIIAPIKAAFRDIFPATTGKQLADITKNIRDFFEKLKMGEETAFKVRRIFQGFFAALDIGWMIIKKVGATIKNLLGFATEGSGGFLDFAAKIADWVTGLRSAIKYGDGLTELFKGIETVLRVPVQIFKTLASVIGAVASSFGKAAPAVDKINGNLQEVGAAGQEALSVWDRIKAAFQGLLDFFGPSAQKLADYFSGITDAIRESFSNGNYQAIIDSINTGFLGGLTLLFKKFMKDGMSVGIFSADGLSDVFDNLTGSLKAMQQNVKADTLLKIAGALALLTISVVALSMIDPSRLALSLGAMAIMFTQLAGAMLLFEKATSFMGSLRLPLIAAGLVLLAVAIGILAISIKILSTLSWEELLKGLTGLTVVLGALAGFTQLMSKNSSQMLIAGAGFLLLSIAISLFASAVQQFANMNWDEMARGLTGVGAVLAGLALFTRLAALNKMGLANGAGLVLLGISLKIIASAVKDFGSMDMGTLGKGIGGMAASLTLVALAMRALPKSIILQAVGLVVLSDALRSLAITIIMLGSVDIKTLGVGLGVMAASLVVIAAGLKLLSTALVGAAALWIAVDALANLAMVLTTLGQLGMGGTIAALVTIAGALTILGVAGYVMAPVLPVLQSLGVAILTMGYGAMAAGVGLFMAAAGLVALSATGVAAGVAITAVAAAVIGILPAALKALAEGLVLMADVIGKAGPSFVRAMTTLILSLVTAIGNALPKVVATLVMLIHLLLDTLQKNVPGFLQKAVNIIVAILQGLAQGVPKIAKAGADLIISLIKAIGDQQLRILKAAAETIIKFVNGLADEIRKQGPAFGKAGANILSAIVEGLVGGVGAFAGTLAAAARRIGGQFMDSIKSFFGIHSPSRVMHKMGGYVMEGFGNGLDDNNKHVKSAFGNLERVVNGSMERITSDKGGHSAIDAMRKSIVGLSDVVDGNLELRPVISPVLDLTDLERNARGIGKIVGTPTISVGSGYHAAKNLQAAYRQKNMDEFDPDPSFRDSVENTTYVQNNYSPKALSNADIYRQTKNQLSVVKGAVSSA